MNKTVLIVDDSMYMRALIKGTLEAEGYEVVGEASNGEVAIDMALDLNPDLITLDNVLPDMVARDMLKVFKEQKILSKVIMVSAVGQQSAIKEGIELGASDYIVKPFTSHDLLEAINGVF